MALINSMSTRGKLTLAACALGFLAAAVFIVKMAGAPSYTTVMTGVDPAKTSQITTALTAAGVPFELQNGGTAVGVQKGKETAANVALASKGLNSGTTQPGFEILDKQKLGASSQQQQIAYQRGLEGTIANTIGQIDGAGGAQVHLTLGQDNLFADESQPATAAVLLPQDASGMDPASVKGIANLVAASVPALKASSVTITDGSGAMLWPSGGGAGGGGGADGLPSKTAAEAKYNASSEASLQSLLDRTLGQDKAQVVVHSDLNVDKIDEQALTYTGKTVALAEKTTTESLKGTGSTSGGTSGTASNLPSYAANATGGSGTNNYKNTTVDKTNGADKTITKTQKATGAVNRLDVAVLLDKSVKLQSAQMTRAEGQPRLGRRPADRPAQGHAEHHRGPRVRQGADHGRQGGPDPGGLRRHPQGRRYRPRRAAVPLLRHAPSAQARAWRADRRAVVAAHPRGRAAQGAHADAGPLRRRRGGDRCLDRQRRPAAPAARLDHPG